MTQRMFRVFNGPTFWGSPKGSQVLPSTVRGPEQTAGSERLPPTSSGLRATVQTGAEFPPIGKSFSAVRDFETTPRDVTVRQHHELRPRKQERLTNERHHPARWN